MKNANKNDSIEKRTSFDFLRYANCWEDADILLEALKIKEGGVYLSVCSAGDNTLSILSGNPSLIIAADISFAQLACLEIKKAAFRYLDYEDVLRFLGIRDSANRVNVYRYLSSSLLGPVRSYWNKNLEFIKKGIIHGGKFEGYFKIFRKWLLPLIHGRNEIEELRRKKSIEERAKFYRLEWNTFSWKLVFKLFFSRIVMGRLGRDPEFFRYVEGDVSGHFLKRAESALINVPAHNNPYLEYILTGSFNKALPHYLRPENFDTIRNGLGRIVLFKGNVVEALDANRGLKFDGFNLSDIFEYMSYGEYLYNLNRHIKSSRKGGHLVYWNMLTDRVPPSEYLEHIDPLEELASELYKRDKAFFYKTFRIEAVR